MAVTSRNGGFSLVEISIILTLFGVLFAALLGDRMLQRKDMDYRETAATLAIVEDALQDFYLQHGHLPCPANWAAQPDSRFFGVATDCSDPSIAGMEMVQEGNAADEYQIRIGGVPTRTLGIEDRHFADQWGNRLHYGIIRTLGINSAAYNNYAPTQLTGFFQILDETGTVIYGNDEEEIIAYLLLSTGEDGFGARTEFNGQELSACDTSLYDQLDHENCNHAAQNKQFIDAPIRHIAADATHFFDMVRWNTKRYFDGL